MARINSIGLALEDLANWYIQKRPIYESLLEIVKSIIDSMLTREGIRYYHVQTRVKEFGSFETKLSRKKYTHLEDMTDVAGLRVVCYLREDKEIVSGLLEDNFDVINREDKSLNSGGAKMGYDTIHLDATLAGNRVILPEHQQYKDLKFEIQVYFKSLV